MTGILHILRPLLLALLLAVTGQAVAMARGAPPAAGQVELCTGTGPVMVFVDADGQPVRPPHYCPEGVSALLQAVALPVLSARPPTRAHRLHVLPRSWSAPSLRPVPALARGPPAARLVG